MGDFLLSFFDMEKSPLIAVAQFLTVPLIFVGITGIAYLAIALVLEALRLD